MKKNIPWSFRITGVRLLMQKQGSSHLNLFLALENKHIVNSLTGVVQMLPFNGFQH